LELAALALAAVAVVAAVPRATNPLAYGDVLDAVTELDNVADNLVPGNSGEDVTKVTPSDADV
jgi:hypothetical protein